MALTRKAPNTILLSQRDQVIIDDTLKASAAITPGMLVEMAASGGETTWVANAAAADVQYKAVALNAPYLNDGIDTDYASGDRVPVAFLTPGAVFYGIIPSGQDIAVGDHLQSNGDGKMKEATATTAAASVAHFQSLDAPGAVTADTRLRVVVVA